jgi:hypothetical protein
MAKRSAKPDKKQNSSSFATCITLLGGEINFNNSL